MRQNTFADTASLLSDTSRAAMLLALLDGRAYTATELAHSANISAQAASFHLKRLVSANLLACVSRGRYRYFRLAGPDVARLLESLLALDQLAKPKTIGTSCPESLRDARACYNHIAGRAGVHLYQTLMQKGWLVFKGSQLVPTGGAQALLHGNPPRELGIHLHPVLEVAFSRGLRGLQRRLGILHQVPGFLAILRIAGHAALHLHDQLAPVDAEGPLKESRDRLLRGRTLGSAFPERTDAHEGATA